MTRIAVLGGSSVSTPQFAEALAGWARESGRDVELVLVGRSTDKLRTVAAACSRVAAKAPGGTGVTVRWSVDIDEGLDGADIVLNQVRVGGLQARAFDERFPWRLGLPGEETMGPGGFSNACRTLPVVRDLFERCAAAAPDALIVNLDEPGRHGPPSGGARRRVSTGCDALRLAGHAGRKRCARGRRRPR